MPSIDQLISVVNIFLFMGYLLCLIMLMFAIVGAFFYRNNVYILFAFNFTSNGTE